MSNPHPAAQRRGQVHTVYGPDHKTPLFTVYGPSSDEQPPAAAPVSAPPASPPVSDFSRRKQRLQAVEIADREAAVRDKEWLADVPLNQHLQHVYGMIETNTDYAYCVLAQHGDALPDAVWTCIRHLIATQDQGMTVLYRAVKRLEEAETAEARVQAAERSAREYNKQITRARDRLTRRRKQTEYLSPWILAGAT